MGEGSQGASSVQVSRRESSDARETMASCVSRKSRTPLQSAPATLGSSEFREPTDVCSSQCGWIPGSTLVHFATLESPETMMQRCTGALCMSICAHLFARVPLSLFRPLQGAEQWPWALALFAEEIENGLLSAACPNGLQAGTVLSMLHKAEGRSKAASFAEQLLADLARPRPASATAASIVAFF